MAVLLAEGPGTADGALDADILGEGRVPDHAGPIVILFHQSLGQGQHIAGGIDLQPPVLIRCGRVGVGVGRVIEHHARAGVEVVLIGVGEERIAAHGFAEGVLEVVDADHAQRQRRNLIPDAVSVVADVTEGSREDVARILGTVLEIVGQGDVGAGNGPSAKAGHGEAEQFGETDAGGDAELRGTDGPVDLEILSDLHLEVAHETDVEPFSAMEDVLVVETDLRRETDQTVGVGGRLDVETDAAGIGRLDADGAVDGGGGIRGGRQLDVDAVEIADGREPGIGVRDDGFAVGPARNDAVDLP